MRLLVLLAALVAAPGLSASFELSRQPLPQASLFPTVERGGGEDKWPWRGVQISGYSSFGPTWASHDAGGFFAQSLDVGFPIMRDRLSVFGRVEGTVSGGFIGGVFDLGVRVHLPMTQIFGLYFEGAGRYASGEFPSGWFTEIVASIFGQDIDIGPATGFGLGLTAGLELGGPRGYFITALTYSYLSLSADVFENDRFTDTTSLNLSYLGIVIGFRVYAG